MNTHQLRSAMGSAVAHPVGEQDPTGSPWILLAHPGVSSTYIGENASIRTSQEK